MNIIGEYLIEVEEILVFFEVYHAIVRDFQSYNVTLKIELLMLYGVVGSQKQTTIELLFFSSQYFIKDLRQKG